GKSTPIPLVAGARQEKDQGELGRRVRTTCWVDGQPGRRQPRTALNSEGATRQILVTTCPLASRTYNPPDLAVAEVPSVVSTEPAKTRPAWTRPSAFSPSA